MRDNRMDTDTLCKICCLITLIGFLAASASVYVTFVPEHKCEYDSFVIYIGIDEKDIDEINSIESTVMGIFSEHKMPYTTWVAKGSHFANGVESHQETLVFKIVNSDSASLDKLVHEIQQKIPYAEIFLETYHSHDVELIVNE